MVFVDSKILKDSSIYAVKEKYFVKKDKISVATLGNEHVIVVQKGKVAGDVSSKKKKELGGGDVVFNKKFFPKLKTSLFSSLVDARVYFIPMEQVYSTIVNTVAKFKTGEVVSVAFNGKVSLYLEDAQKWYDTFIKSIKAQDRNGVIYTRDAFKDMITSVVESKIRKLISQNNRPVGTGSTIKVYRSAVEAKKQPETSLFEIIKEGITSELKAVGFKADFYLSI